MSSILFASHDRDLCAVASRVLRKVGWQVTAVAHGGHALLACVEGRTFDVLVVEDQMPGDTGAAIAWRLRRYRPDIRVVYLQEHHARRESRGITVVRPFTADDLIDAVREATVFASA